MKLAPKMTFLLRIYVLFTVQISKHSEIKMHLFETKMA